VFCLKVAQRGCGKARRSQDVLGNADGAIETRSRLVGEHGALAVEIGAENPNGDGFCSVCGILRYKVTEMIIEHATLLHSVSKNKNTPASCDAFTVLCDACLYEPASFVEK
jgi:hypothetical protein